MSQKQLEKEAEFFVSISGGKQTNDELRSLIIEVNNSANERQQIIEEINSPISELDRPIRILKARFGRTTERVSNHYEEKDFINKRARCSFR